MFEEEFTEVIYKEVTLLNRKESYLNQLKPMKSYNITQHKYIKRINSKKIISYFFYIFFGELIPNKCNELLMTIDTCLQMSNLLLII